MKYILILLLALTQVHAGLFSVAASMGMQTVKPDAEYKVSTSGFSPRVYEFTTKTQPYMRCIVLFSSSNENSSPTMQCVKVDR